MIDLSYSQLHKTLGFACSPGNRSWSITLGSLFRECLCIGRGLDGQGTSDGGMQSSLQILFEYHRQSQQNRIENDRLQSIANKLQLQWFSRIDLSISNYCTTEKIISKWEKFEAIIWNWQSKKGLKVGRREINWIRNVSYNIMGENWVRRYMRSRKRFCVSACFYGCQKIINMKINVNYSFWHYFNIIMKKIGLFFIFTIFFSVFMTNIYFFA